MNKIQTQDRKIVMGTNRPTNNIFDVYYSTDGTNYYKALINSRIRLASIGASELVCIPVDSTQLKLVNIANTNDITIEQLTAKAPNGVQAWTDGNYYSYMEPFDRNNCKPDGSSLYVWRSVKPIYETLFYEYPAGQWQESSSSCVVGRSIGTSEDPGGLAGTVARWNTQGGGSNPYQISVSASFGESCWNVASTCLF